MQANVNFASTIYDVVVLGGGAAGLMAAIEAAGTGASVALLECNDSLGKKLLATGNGRCNFSNEVVSAEHYFGDERFIDEVLAAYTTEDALRFFVALGIIPVSVEGRLYPNSMKAESVLTALSKAAKALGVEVNTGFKVQGVVGQELPATTHEGYRIVSASGEEIFTRAVILAMGGKASEIRGSNGDGYYYAKSFGHAITEQRPSLVPLTIADDPLLTAAGVRCSCQMKLYIDGATSYAAMEAGELQLTSTGLSGVMVFQLSHLAGEALAAGKTVTASLNLLPELDRRALTEYFAHQARAFGAASVIEVLTGILPRALAEAVLVSLGIEFETTMGELGGAGNLIDRLLNYPVTITGTGTFKQAQVTAGGIATADISPKTCGSMLRPGLYFAGEIMDVDGICGGYNLQWAWSTGALAGRAAGKYALESK